jgi:hypothetical protein
MSDQPTLLSLEENGKLTKPIEINIRRMKMKDYDAMANIKTGGWEANALMLTIIGRISNYSEAELWDMELEEFNKVQTAFVEAMDNVVKKANAGNSTSS